MGFENEVKAIPQDLEGLVKGDIKLGKFHIPKAAIAAVVVGGVAVFAYVNRNKSGGSSTGNGDVGNGTFGTSQGDSSTVSGGGVGSTDSGTTPIDNGSNPSPSIPSNFLDNPNPFGLPLDTSNHSDTGFTLPSLPDFNNGSFSLPSLPSFGDDSGYFNQVPYMSYGDSGNSSQMVNPTSSQGYSSNPVQTSPIQRVINSVKGVGSVSGFAGSAASKPQVLGISNSNAGASQILAGSAAMVKSPITNNVVRIVNGVGGASSFGGSKPVIALPKPVQNVKQIAPILQNTFKPITNIASLFTNFFRPAPAPVYRPTPAPVYHPPVIIPYHPASLPKVNNGINYFKNLTTHVGNGGV